VNEWRGACVDKKKEKKKTFKKQVPKTREEGRGEKAPSGEFPDLRKECHKIGEGKKKKGGK